MVLTDTEPFSASGLRYLLTEYGVDNLYSSDSNLASEINPVHYYHGKSAPSYSLSTVITTVTSGGSIDLGTGITTTVLSPDADTDYTDPDSDNMVLETSYGSNSFLFAGDISSDQETALAEKYDVNADVLFIASHDEESGIAYSESFMEECSPQYSVVDVPSTDSTISSSAYAGTVLGTDVNGTIVFTTDGTTLTSSYSDASSAALSADSFALYTGDRQDISVTGTDLHVKWSSSDPSIASVCPSEDSGTSDAVIHAKQAGTCTITATVGGRTLSCDVTITALSLNKTNLKLYVDGTYALTATVPDGATVAWASDDTDVATVDDSGNVTAIAKGKATITATVTLADGTTRSLTCKVNVKDKSLSSNSEKVKRGKSFHLSLTGATGKTKWVSSNSSVATVTSSGTVKTSGKGTAVITATNGTTKTKCVVVVK